MKVTVFSQQWRLNLSGKLIVQMQQGNITIYIILKYNLKNQKP